MKKILLSALLIYSVGVNAQTIDTNSLKPYAVVKLVTPFSPKWGDTTKASFLMIESKDDNLKDNVTFRYVLFQKRWNESATIRNHDNTQDSVIVITKGGLPLVDGYIKCEGADYKAWDGNNKFPFQFVADKIGLGIK